LNFHDFIGAHFAIFVALGIRELVAARRLTNAKRHCGLVTSVREKNQNNNFLKKKADFPSPSAGCPS
jgi:hypothetical protein